MSKAVMIDAAALAADTGTTKDQAQARLDRHVRTFESMRPWFPKRCMNFLDIGCGHGGIALLVAQHFAEATAHLIDGTADGERFAYRPDGKPWADVGTALRLFERYLPARVVKAWPPNLVVTIPCELIYSNCSWGHHYAIETYLETAWRSLLPGGVLIVDLRIGDVGKHGRNMLRTRFTHVADVEFAEQKKYARTVWRSE